MTGYIKEPPKKRPPEPSDEDAGPRARPMKKKLRATKGYAAQQALLSPSAHGSQDSDTSSSTTDPNAGGVRVSTSSSKRETALDGVYTRDLSSWLDAMPGLSLDGALDRFQQHRFARRENYSLGQLSTSNQVTPMKGGRGAGLGVLVANSNYQHCTKLPGTIADAQGLSQSLAGRGFETQVETDLASDAMLASYENLATDPRIADTERVMLYFSGHGSPTGVYGVDWTEGSDRGMIPSSAVMAAAQRVADRGPDVNVVIDACFSGGMNQQVGETTIEGKAKRGAEALGPCRTSDFVAKIEALRTPFERAMRSEELQAEIDAALAPFNVYKDAIWGRYSTIKSTIRDVEDLIADGDVSQETSQRLAELRAEAAEVKLACDETVRVRGEIIASVLIPRWHEMHPKLVDLLDAFEQETGVKLDPPIANPQRIDDIREARKEIAWMLSGMESALQP